MGILICMHERRERTNRGELLVALLHHHYDHHHHHHYQKKEIRQTLQQFDNYIFPFFLLLFLYLGKESAFPPKDSREGDRM